MPWKGPWRSNAAHHPCPADPYLGDLFSDILCPLHHLVGSDDLDLCGGARAVFLQVELHEVECKLRDLADGSIFAPAWARPLSTRSAVRAL